MPFCTILYCSGEANSEKSLPVRTLTAQLQRSATFQGSRGQALRAELPSVTFIALGH